MSKQELIDSLTMAGATFKNSSCTCPFHRDKNPSAGIYQAGTGSWRFKCQVCDYNFDNIGVKAHLSGKSPEEIILEQNGGKTDKVYSEAQIRSIFSTEKGYKYLHEYKNEKGTLTHLVAIKYNENGSKEVRQCMSYGFNWIMRNKGKRPLFNLDKIKDSQIVIMVEGEKCVKALTWLGIDATTSMGGSASVDKCDLTPLIGKTVFIWPDNDEAGMRYYTDLKKKFESMSIKSGLINIGDFDLDEKEDVADFVRNCNKEGFTKEEIKQQIEISLSEIEIKTYHDVYMEKFVGNLTSGCYSSVKTEWKCLESTKWLRGGTITLVCAKAGVGKSWFVNNLAINAYNAGYKVSNIQLEEDKEYHVTRAIKTVTGIDLTDPESYTQEDLRLVNEKRKEIEDLGEIIKDVDSNKMDLISIGDLIENECKMGTQLVIVDPISIAEKSARPWEDDQKFINRIKQIAKDAKDFRIVLVTHPKGGKSKEIDIDSLAGGTAYQRLSQCILYLQEEEEKATYCFGPSGRSYSTMENLGNRTIVCLKARNATNKMLSNKFLFEFRRGKFKELGFMD